MTFILYLVGIALFVYGILRLGTFFDRRAEADTRRRVLERFLRSLDRGAVP